MIRDARFLIGTLTFAALVGGAVGIVLVFGFERYDGGRWVDESVAMRMIATVQIWATAAVAVVVLGWKTVHAVTGGREQ